ncbi:MAG: 2OG-Fe(II) oxygenase [Pelagibacteraceae bacterium]
MDIDELIYFEQNSLTREFCDHVIDKFKKSEHRRKGITGGGYSPDAKLSTDLSLSHVDGWGEEDKVFSEALFGALERYRNYLNCLMPGMGSTITGDGVYDNGYQLQETKPYGFYSWHHDYCSVIVEDEDDKPCVSNRMVTFLWYLNDIEENGYTEFVGSSKVQPECGKLMLFPATWTYFHRGYPPKREMKYICTGWIWKKQPKLVAEENADIPE